MKYWQYGSLRFCFSIHGATKVRIILLALIVGLSGCSDSPDPVDPDLPVSLPSPVTDLSVSTVTSSRAVLKWTVPAGGDPDWPKLRISLRMSDAEITEENWDEAALPWLEYTYSHFDEGAVDSAMVRYLKPGTDYWFAARVHRFDFNLSDLDSSISVTTMAQDFHHYRGRINSYALRSTSLVPYSADFLLVHVHGLLGYSPTMRVDFVDLRSPDNPDWRSGSFDFEGLAFGVCTDGALVYILGQDGFWSPTEQPLSIHVWSALPDPVELGSCLAGISERTTYNWNGSLCVAGNFLFVGSDVLGIVDISLPNEPVLVRNFTGLAYEPRRLGNLGSNLISWDVETQTPLQVIDVSNINQINTLSLFHPGTPYRKVVPLGDLVILLTEDSQLQVVDFSDPSRPNLLGFLDLGPREVDDLSARENMAYVVGKERGLEFVDLSNPAQPVFTGRYDIATAPVRVLASNAGIYVTDWIEGENFDSIYYLLILDNQP